MRYMLLIYAHEAEWETYSETEQAEVMRGHAELMEDLVKACKYRVCDALEPTRSATTVRVRGGKTLLTDGPFAETKEQLAGFYLIEARDLNDAIQVASRIPSARMGSIEVRPIMEFTQ
jgi:hypothetical protein